MIRSTLTQRGNLLGDLLAYVTSFQEEVNQTQADVVTELTPDILDELGYTPDKRSYPDEYPLPWTSDLQRRWYGANIGEYPYIRTGGTAAGWIVTNDGAGNTVIANNTPGALYVYGSLAKTNPGAHQQLFNLITGWPNGYESVKFWTDAIIDETVARIDEQFKGLAGVSVTSRTRAYTRR